MSDIASPIPGSNVLLMGESGTGKTYAIRSLIEAGITPFVIFTEPGMETLNDLPADKWHWAYVRPTGEDWDTLTKMAETVNRFNFESISKYTDPNKAKFTNFAKVLYKCQNFVDSNGEEFGDVTTWGTDRALVIDSLSGLSDMAMQLIIGGKPLAQLNDWQLAQNTLEHLLNKLTTDTQCFFVLTAHQEREKDEVTGGTSVMVATLGRKLAPKIPKYFSDVVQCVRENADFYWDTAAYNVACKTRNLPIASKQKPSFVPLVNKWKERGGIITPTSST